MSANAYKAAIELLLNGNVDYRDIVIKLAKQQPSLFIALAAPPEAPKSEPYEWIAGKAILKSELTSRHSDIINLLRGNQKVSAIKALRELYGVGLKEAKDVIDNLCNYLANRSVSYSHLSNDYANPLDRNLHSIYAAIVGDFE